jgi:glutathione S-transferase
MSEFLVHLVPGSPFARSVLMALEEKSAPYQVRHLAPGSLRTPEHLSLHPFGKIPVLEHGDFRLYETQAIIRYVDAVVPGVRLQPADPRAAARMDQIIGINDWYLFPDLGVGVVFQRIVGPILLGLEPDEAAIAQALPKAAACLAELNRLLGDNAFLAGDMLSIADLMVAPHLAYFAQTPEARTLLDGTPLAAWLERMGERPSMQATLPPPMLQPVA